MTRTITQPYWELYWDYRRGGIVWLAYQVTEANETSVTRFDDMPSTYPDAAEMVEEYWSTRRGITRGLVSHMREHLEAQRGVLGNRANRAVASRLHPNEQTAIYLLMEADAAAQYRVGISAAEVREILDRWDFRR